MEYSRGSEVEKEIGDTANPPRPRDKCGLREKRQLQQSLVFSRAVDSQTFTARLRTMESVLYNNNLLPKVQKNKAGEKLSALF